MQPAEVPISLGITLFAMVIAWFVLIKLLFNRLEQAHQQKYEAMGRQLVAVHTDRFISPYGDEHKAKLLASANGGESVNLISEVDAQHYEKAARKHLTNFRLTVLGGCMKNGQCDGDCVSSVGDCAGGDGDAPCINVLFDRSRADANKKRLEGVIEQLEMTSPGTPRYRFIEQEKRGLENYFAYIRKAA